jgi:Asp-tRNA(Asn)/Glu-tRNA(Gln) amidotransferase A subunit family amidase
MTGATSSASETLAALARSLEDGSTTVEGVARRFLDRIALDDPTLRAWVHVDRDAVLAHARRLDRVAPPSRGPLHGIPIGVKDIFDTHDMPTEYGSPIYAGHRPELDAASVAAARRMGMLPLGKLVTTEFAAWPPGPTVNPHDVTRTPGGSSSGSAAAVAAGMVPVAFATQTTGSIIRPAAFCGVVGYKPSHGTLPTAGVKAISESFDTVGVIARTVADAALVVGALSGRSLEPTSAPSAPRLGVCLTHEWPAAAPETVALFDVLPDVLARAGARMTAVALPDAFAGLAAAQSTMWTFEIARCLADEHERFRELIREPLLGMLDDGAAMPVSEYETAAGCLRECRTRLGEIFDGVDALLVPAAPGEAPEVGTTGDPIFNRGWSALGVPAVGVPAGVGSSGLPLGVQVVAPPKQDARALACAAWVEAALGRAARTFA